MLEVAQILLLIAIPLLLALFSVVVAWVIILAKKLDRYLDLQIGRLEDSKPNEPIE